MVLLMRIQRKIKVPAYTGQGHFNVQHTSQRTIPGSDYYIYYIDSDGSDVMAAISLMTTVITYR